MRMKPVRPTLFGCDGGEFRKPFLGMHKWEHSYYWNGNDRTVLPFETGHRGISRGGWRCYHCGQFQWDQADYIYALKHAYALGLVKIPASPMPDKEG